MASIHAIETAVPENYFLQDEARDALKASTDDRLAQRLVHRLYSQSGIHKRHSVVHDFNVRAEEGLFYDPPSNTFKSPSTKVRNDLYAQASKPLYTGVARKVLDASQFGADDVTHVITVSCTGFFAPGPDFYVVKDLCLRPSTQRFHVGFMGCYAAFPALKMARAFCDADPDAVVLIVCLELCTLHLQLGADMDRLLSASVFADGAAGAVVSAKRPQSGKRVLEVSQLETTLTPTGEADMAWTVGDNGFDIVLSSYVPNILEANLEAALTPLFASLGRTPEEVQHWAIHPGGRAILDKIQKGLSLSEAQLEPSRQTLFDYGNMSSATVLFVLKEVMERAQPREDVCAMAFGPGLTVESGLFTVC